MVNHISTTNLHEIKCSFQSQKFRKALHYCKIIFKMKYTIVNDTRIRVWFSSYLPTNQLISSFLDYPHLPSFPCDPRVYGEIL